MALIRSAGVGRLLALVALAVSTAGAETTTLEWQATGLTAFQGGYRPTPLTLATTAPEGVTAPDGVSEARFGSIPLGAGTDQITCRVVLGKAADGNLGLWVDADGSGKLERAAGFAKPEEPRMAAQLAGFGGFTLKPKLGGKQVELAITAYQFLKSDQRPTADTTLFWYADGGYKGELKLGDATYTIWLAEATPKLAFGKPQPKGGLTLFVDRNADGKVAVRGERFDAGAPFNIGGTTYEVSDLAGGVLTYGKSAQTVAEVALPPDLRVGQVAPSFKATTLSGKALNFPADYAGKVVLLDFWATWCGPCLAELPNVVKTYEEWHAKGLEILGISFDRENMAEKLKNEFLPQHKMPWEQIYDGKYWSTEIGTLYAVQGIPMMLLVEGGTGKILASSPRGPALPAAVAKALGGQ